MGWYINNIGTTFIDKVNTLKNIHHATVTETPTEWVENIVCVVDNGAFAAAAWMKDQRELDYWLSDKTNRKRVWLLVPNASSLAQ